ncbi:MAG TPA: hypothetical protein PLD27_00555 [bacterium]|nr:hypothetical protein [bacterium]HOL47210.1 hypothetical protein [bacterium]HPQ18281.1 hypothetical protein [bacterium]
MDKELFKKYIEAQINEIEKYKWIESEKHGYDIGRNRAAYEWITKYSKSFRDYWFKTYKLV